MQSTKSNRTVKARQPDRQSNGSTQPARSPSVALLPTLDQLPATLPKSGMVAIVHRSKLNAASYNPRQIDHYAAEGLKESIRRTGGLVEIPVWNRRSGNIVSGHQRIAAEDKRRGTKDYELTVNVVDWDDAMEKEVNVALNNPSIRGTYDLDLLQDLLKEDGFDWMNAGFDAAGLENLFLDGGRSLDLESLVGGDETESKYTPVPQGTVEAVAAADDIADQLDEADAAKVSQRERERRESEKRDKAAQANIDRRKAMKDEYAFKCDTGIARTIVFPTSDLAKAFMRFLQKPELDEKIDGVQLVNFLELDIPEFQKYREPAADSPSLSNENESETQDDSGEPESGDSESGELDGI